MNMSYTQIYKQTSNEMFTFMFSWLWKEYFQNSYIVLITNQTFNFKYLTSVHA